MNKINPYVLPGVSPEKITFSKIQKVVCSHYGVDFEDIKGVSRKRKYVVPRQLIAYLGMMYLDEILAVVGKYINRNHATVLYSINTINDRMDIYPELVDEIGILREQIVGCDVEIK